MTIDVTAGSFLRGMVRRIVAVLLEVGHGRLDESEVARALVAGRPALDGAALRRRDCAFGGSSWDDRSGRMENTEKHDREDLHAS